VMWKVVEWGVFTRTRPFCPGTSGVPEAAYFM
jgi:hypothetical protein